MHISLEPSSVESVTTLTSYFLDEWREVKFGKSHCRKHENNGRNGVMEDLRTSAACSKRRIDESLTDNMIKIPEHFVKF